MITLTFKGPGGKLFDPVVVMGATAKATRRALLKAGAFVRTRARSSLRKRKGVSAPGGAPYSHVGTLRKFLLFAYDPGSASVVIGPARVGGVAADGEPALLEYGGRSSGGDREVLISNPTGRDASGRFTSGGRRRAVIKGNTEYKARPFMGPALKAELPGLPAMWRDSVR